MGDANISKRALVSWNKICLPKGAGGLNIINIKIWNQAAICNLLWALSQNKKKLWITWIHTYLHNKAKLARYGVSSSSCLDNKEDISYE